MLIIRTLLPIISIFFIASCIIEASPTSHSKKIHHRHSSSSKVCSPTLLKDFSIFIKNSKKYKRPVSSNDPIIKRIKACVGKKSLLSTKNKLTIRKLAENPTFANSLAKFCVQNKKLSSKAFKFQCGVALVATHHIKPKPMKSKYKKTSTKKKKNLSLKKKRTQLLRLKKARKIKKTHKLAAQNTDAIFDNGSIDISDSDSSLSYNHSNTSYPPSPGSQMYPPTAYRGQSLYPPLRREPQQTADVDDLNILDDQPTPSAPDYPRYNPSYSPNPYSSQPTYPPAPEAPANTTYPHQPYQQYPHTYENRVVQPMPSAPPAPEALPQPREPQYPYPAYNQNMYPPVPYNGQPPNYPPIPNLPPQPIGNTDIDFSKLGGNSNAPLSSDESLGLTNSR